MNLLEMNPDTARNWNEIGFPRASFAILWKADRKSFYPVIGSFVRVPTSLPRVFNNKASLLSGQYEIACGIWMVYEWGREIGYPMHACSRSSYVAPCLLTPHFSFPLHFGRIFRTGGYPALVIPSPFENALKSGLIIFQLSNFGLWHTSCQKLKTYRETTGMTVSF